MKSRKKRTLWSVASTCPVISPARIRWCRTARARPARQAGQPHSGSSGRSSSRKAALRIRSSPGAGVEQAVPRVARRQHAVEEVDAPARRRAGCRRVCRPPSGSAGLSSGSAGAKRATTSRLGRGSGSPTRDTADRVAVEGERFELLDGALAQARIDAALDDAEERGRAAAVALARPARPGQRCGRARRRPRPRSPATAGTRRAPSRGRRRCAPASRPPTPG